MKEEIYTLKNLLENEKSLNERERRLSEGEVSF